MFTSPLTSLWPNIVFDAFVPHTRFWVTTASSSTTFSGHILISGFIIAPVSKVVLLPITVFSKICTPLFTAAPLQITPPLHWTFFPIFEFFHIMLFFMEVASCTSVSLPNIEASITVLPLILQLSPISTGAIRLQLSEISQPSPIHIPSPRCLYPIAVLTFPVKISKFTSLYTLRSPMSFQ